tara:strand:- start:21 stop:251 length:231 start_codon:yes stop_codon:yes gene_type:complete
MALNDVSIKIIKGSITGSQTSADAFSFAKEVADFIETVDGPAIDYSGSLGRVLNIDYVPNGNLHMTAIITVSGSLP